MAKTPEEMQASMIANLEEKTGKSLAEWMAIARASGKTKHGEIVQHLKGEHGVGHGYANLIVHSMKSGGPPVGAAGAAEGDGDLVEQQYAGPKADLKPIYEALIERVKGFGDDVEIAPKKTYVSLRRSKQFGLIQPSTKTRVDVGLNLKETEPEGRLEAAGSFNSMVSHRVKVSDPSEVDDQLAGWLRRAYEQA